MKISWLKLSVDLFTDKKIILLRKMPSGDTLLVLWTWLLCEGMKSSIPGTITMMQDGDISEEISILSGIETNTVRLGLAFFQKHKMVNLQKDGSISITNFRTHQNIDALEYKRALAFERKRRFNENSRKKLLALQNASGTRSEPVLFHTEIEIETEIEKEIKNKEKDKPQFRNEISASSSAIASDDILGNSASPKEKESRKKKDPSPRRSAPTPSPEGKRLFDYVYGQLKDRGALPSDEKGTAILFIAGKRSAEKIVSQVGADTAIAVYEWAFKNHFRPPTLSLWSEIKTSYDKKNDERFDRKKLMEALA